MAATPPGSSDHLLQPLPVPSPPAWGQLCAYTTWQLPPVALSSQCVEEQRTLPEDVEPDEAELPVEGVPGGCSDASGPCGELSAGLAPLKALCFHHAAGHGSLVPRGAVRGPGTPEKACRLVGLLRNLHKHEGGIGQGWEKLVGEEIIWGHFMLVWAPRTGL